ncbi:MAG: HEAT repeat domain-containing protein, partial [Kiritimatiellae bacterium]|nr:HEAT repeat domain-containing protein [Kiritimatiellia bacterium]
REKLLPEQELKALAGRADKTIAQLRPIVKQAKASQAAQEHKRDLDAIPGLIEKCASPEATVRREAVQELGRIGNAKAAPTLVKALKDADTEVRVNAILGLGWMQSSEAVPALVEIAGGDDLRLRRRAVQALGQIGDPRAIPALNASISHRDYFVSENAILALGWLKAKTAAPELLKIVTSFDAQNAEQRGLMLAAIRALGHIGDAAALPALEKLAKEADDFPLSRRGNKKISNIYSTAQSLGLQGHAELAVTEIKAGGRGATGIKQADFLAATDNFYGMTRRFNALAGRTDSLRGTNFKADPAALWPYLWEAGLTGIHQAWAEQDSDPVEYFKLIEAANEFDLRWIEVLPHDGNTFGPKRRYADLRQHGVEKAGAETVLLKHADIPALKGFWGEETYPEVKLTAAEFEAWLTARHGADFRSKLGLAKDYSLAGVPVKKVSGYAGPLVTLPGPLNTEYQQCCADKLLEHWRESQEWLHGMRKGCAFTFSVSTVATLKFPGLTARGGDAIFVNGPENYQCFGRYNSYFMEMYKDGRARPVMSEFYNWYSPSPAQDVRGFAQHLMHGECFYNFCLDHVFEQPSSDLWSWDASRWENLSKIFQKARKIREYLDVPASAANVGLLYEDLSFLALDPNIMSTLSPRWYQHQGALWTALNQSQIPTDIIWLGTLTPEKMKRYRVLVLADAKIVTPEQAQKLSEWVNQGGTLIACGATSLFSQRAELQKDYQLAELFGVNYLGQAGVSDPEKIDTYCYKSGGATSCKVVSGLDPQNSGTHVHRDIKPVKSLGTYTVAARETGYLPGIKPGTECEYDLPLGYDQVKESTAEVLGRFAGSDPALTVNKFGLGLCYFWTPNYPGLCHVTSDWEMQANRLDFWPNVRELLAAMVKGGLAHGKQALPVEIEGVSKEIEVTVRQQPEKSCWMVHLLNYDPKVDLVKSPHLSVNAPEGRTVKRMFYPDTGTEVKFTPSATGVTALLRNFDVHDMVVIEWDR